MKTPKEYTENCKNRIITTSMLEDALFSVNKRAKNWRDKKREAITQMKSSFYYDRYSSLNIENAENQQQKYYVQKEILLSIVNPICIHREFAGYEKQRIYSNSSDYNLYYFDSLIRNFIVWKNSFWQNGKTICFYDRIDKTKPQYRYYIYKAVGTHTFHTPIEESELGQYGELPIIDINTLQTEGKEIGTLISPQFISKIIDLIQSQNFSYVKDKETILPVYENNISTLQPYYNTSEMATIIWKKVLPVIKKKFQDKDVSIREISEEDKKYVKYIPRKIKKNKKPKEAKIIYSEKQLCIPPNFEKYIESYILSAPDKLLTKEDFAEYLFNSDLYSYFCEYEASLRAIKKYYTQQKELLENGLL